MIMGAGPAHAVHFGTYEMVKEMAGGNVEGVQNQWIATCACWSYCLTSSQTSSHLIPIPLRLFPIWHRRNPDALQIRQHRIRCRDATVHRACASYSISRRVRNHRE